MKNATCDLDYIKMVIDAAGQLGITVTEAKLGTEHCQAWADRVLGAKAKFEAGDIKGCQELIREANRYASTSDRAGKILAGILLWAFVFWIPLSADLIFPDWGAVPHSSIIWKLFVGIWGGVTFCCAFGLLEGSARR
jgi:hypothetical protein